MGEPLYTTINSVKVRLTNKVQFQKKGEDCKRGDMPYDLLCQLIADAETEVEQDLRGRYKVPFTSIKHGNFINLPDHTKRAIRSVVDFLSVVKILETDFGRGSHVNGENYYQNTKEHYNSLIAKLLGRDQEANGAGHDRYRYTPPLEDLCLAKSNAEADDGYSGMIINTDGDEGVEGYAEDSINNPSQRNIPFRSNF